MRCLLRHEGGHASRAGSDFKHNIVGLDMAVFNNVLDDIQIDQKVLAQIRARVKAMPLKELH